MSEIVNLRRWRKDMARAEKERLAEENRLRYGRSRAQRLAEHLGKEKLLRAIEDHRITGSGADEE
ncbi:DUF4169 family protein [Chelativorans sp. Marseille-P2723]|uniref:DUF4169 family protein n=1 Tax=Chelativorans sp. Marseille-P2723 TaxID=2709133 RepID=UPI00156D919F|nr:DUF4169 family protein [Chelativorans sp. Marseille-P2723]